MYTLYWWRQSRASRLAAILLVALLIMPLSIVSAQESGPSSRLTLISELLSIELELQSLRKELLQQSVELDDWRRRSQILSQRLAEAEKRAGKLQRQSAELSVLISQLQVELAESNNDYERLLISSRNQREILSSQIEQVSRERDRATARADRLARNRWLWFGAGVGVGAAAVFRLVQ